MLLESALLTVSWDCTTELKSVPELDRSSLINLGENAGSIAAGLLRFVFGSVEIGGRGPLESLKLNGYVIWYMSE